MIFSTFKGLVDKLYRFKAGTTESFGQRAVREQSVLDDIRKHPGFDALLDTLEGEIRSIFMHMSETDDVEEVVRLHGKWRGIARALAVLEGAVTAKVRGEQAEQEAARQVNLLKVDAIRRKEAVDAMMRNRQSITRTGAS